MNIEEYLNKAGVPRKFTPARLDNVSFFDQTEMDETARTRLVRLYDQCTKVVADKKYGVFLYGTNGCGKSYLASAMLRAYKEKHGLAVARTTSQEINDWFFANNYQGYRARYKSADVLLIEELGREVNFGGQRDIKIKIIENLIKYREEEGKLTLYTSNTDLVGIKRVYSGYVQNIIEGSTIFFKFPDIDFRNELICAYVDQLRKLDKR